MDNSKFELFSKSVIIHELPDKNSRRRLIFTAVNRLIDSLYEEVENLEYFKMTLKDSPETPFSKELVIEWSVPINENS